MILIDCFKHGDIVILWMWQMIYDVVDVLMTLTPLERSLEVVM